MADISKITALNGTTYNIKDATARNNKVEKSGDTMTGNLVVPAARAANTYYGISFDRTALTPVETILYTGIKWVSGSHMPVIHVTGYAYGLSSPVEFKIGFYIYGNKIGWSGVTNMGAWNPTVYLFKYTRSSVEYVAVGFAGSCYFLQLSVDLQDEMGKFNNVVTDKSAWNWSFLTSTGTIPSVDDGTTCVQVPYRADILNPSKVNGHTVNSDVPSGAKFTDTTYSSLTAASGGTAVSLVTTGEKYTWNQKGSGTITGIKMNGASKGTSGVVDLGTVLTAHQDISGKADKSATVSTVAYDSTNKKLTKTINGTTSDIVSVATLKTALALAKGDVGLGNVENKSSATIRGELTKANVTDALGYTPPTSDTNTHRPIQVNGTEILGNNTTALNLKAGSNVSVTNSSGTVTIAATQPKVSVASSAPSSASSGDIWFKIVS